MHLKASSTYSLCDLIAIVEQFSLKIPEIINLVFPAI